MEKENLNKPKFYCLYVHIYLIIFVNKTINVVLFFYHHILTNIFIHEGLSERLFEIKCVMGHDYLMKGDIH